MAENNSFEETFGELNVFQELPNTNGRIHDATDTGLAESSKEFVAKHLLSLFNQTMLKRQEQMEHTLQILFEKGVYNNEKPNKEKGLQINDSTHILGENHAGNNGTTNGPMHTDWDSIKLEPFQQDVDDVYFVDESEDDGYFHDMGSKKKNMKMRMQSTQTPLQRTTGNSFLKTENDMFYNRDSGVDLKVIAIHLVPLRNKKVSNLEPAKKFTPRRTPASKNVITAAQQNKNVAKTYIKTKFKPFVDMKLTPAEVHLSLYIFQVQGDPRIGTSFATKGTLESLCPDKSVNHEIIRLMARKITYDQRHLPSPKTTWCLPPSFVCKVISEMVHCTPYPASYYSPYYEMELWDISQPQQLPTSTNDDNSAIWVLDWMTMGDAFTANISPNLNENLVRMRIALDLVQGAHNQTLNEVLGKA
ncbi:hypothetical protein SESBI_06860 [Sesbania bispinosa]|nr:hypothetical protein SESBI_06860 [Sesbania bispinosa]